MKFHPASIFAKITLQILIIPLTITSFGQNSNHLNLKSSDKTNDPQLEYITREYSAHVETPQEFINGKEYESYYQRSKSKPLLMAGIKRTASILTKTRRYSNISLQYDTFLDEVIYTDTSKTINFRFPDIALNSNIVDGFNLYFNDDSMIFRRFREPECTKENLKEGYYEIAYTGKSKYIIRHYSSYYMREGMNEYDYNRENYVFAGGVYYKIKNKGSLLKLFGEKAGEMNKYLHSARIKIAKADKDQFISILKHYDSL